MTDPVDRSIPVPEFEEPEIRLSREHFDADRQAIDELRNRFGFFGNRIGNEEDADGVDAGNSGGVAVEDLEELILIAAGFARAEDAIRPGSYDEDLQELLSDISKTKGWTEAPDFEDEPDFWKGW